MTCIVHIIKKHDIQSPSVKKVRKLFHRTNRPMAAVKNLHFSIVVHKDKLQARAVRKSRDEKDVFSVWCLVSKIIELVSRNVT